jgi:hypothetical protein
MIGKHDCIGTSGLANVSANLEEARAVAIDIDLGKLSEEELIELNDQIVARLRLMRQVQRFEQMAAFDPGERVSFPTDGGRIVTGVVIRFNQKTVTVQSDTGQHWRVSPSLLSKTKDATPQNVVELRQPGPLFRRQ